MSLEKRLPLALLLSFVVLFAWPFLTGDAQRAAEEAARSERAEQGTSGVDATAQGLEDVSATAPAVPGDAAIGSETSVPEVEAVVGDLTAGAPDWEEWVTFGTPGERGSLFARFSAAGGSLLEVRSGEYWTRRDLDEAERAGLEHRTPILVPVRFLDRGVDRTKGSLTLAPSASARGLAPEDLDRVNWRHERLADGGVRFVYPTPSGVVFTKEFRHRAGTNHIEVRLGLENQSAQGPAGQRVRFVLTAAEAVPPESEDKYYVEPRGVAGHVEDGLEEVQRAYDGRGVAKVLYTSGRPGEITFLGSHSKYFAALLRPADTNAARSIVEVSARPVFDGVFAAQQPEKRAEGYRYVAADAVLELTVPQVGGRAEWDYVLYVGPKSADHFEPEDEAFEQILREDLGFFDGVAGLILKLLRFLHSIVGNWGVSIILLTILVRSALFPLNRRMQTSMARHGTKMKRIQPKIDAVKEKYKDDPKRLREEQAKIIQQEGAIPPLGGCLPLFIQIPIFFGLFSALRVAFDLRQQPFIAWMKDLSQPDKLMRLGADLWVIDMTYLNVLPILMVVLWIAQQKVMPKPTDPQALQMHKMMMWMPIIFGVFLYDYAAGLSLYMITSSLFGIAEFTVIRRIWPLDDREQPKKQGGFLAKLAELQEQAQKMQQQQQQQGRGGQKPGGSGKKGSGR